MSLGRALRQLRREHDAEGALVILGELGRAHPDSRFALERSSLEVEALLALGRDGEALARLDGLPLDQLPRGAERYVVRGELRARAQRWSEARDDFQRALTLTSGQPTWSERALWGRAMARLRLQDREAALADLRTYMDRFPSGRYAREAARLLGTP
jgi:tetratricopeptide (TPR) repeat protein